MQPGGLTSQRRLSVSPKQDVVLVQLDVSAAGDDHGVRAQGHNAECGSFLVHGRDSSPRSIGASPTSPRSLQPWEQCR
jgi:hypothetical protein